MSAFIPEGFGAWWESLSGSSEKRLVPPLCSEPASLLGVLLKLDLSPSARLGTHLGCIFCSRISLQLCVVLVFPSFPHQESFLLKVGPCWFRSRNLDSERHSLRLLPPWAANQLPLTFPPLADFLFFVA